MSKIEVSTDGETNAAQTVNTAQLQKGNVSHSAESLRAFASISPTIADGVFIADTARVIGDVHLGEGSSVWFGSVIRGDVHQIRIGKRVNIQDLSMIHVSHGTHATTIGDDVTVGHRAILHGCTVGDRALIGMGAIVLDGAVIGEESMIGAGALVTPNTVIPPRTLALGSPAKPRRPLSDAEIDNLRKSAKGYQALGQVYAAAATMASTSERQS